MTFGLDVPQNYPCRNVLTLYLSQPGWQEKIPQPDMHSARESLKVKAFLAHGNLTCVTGYQALSPAGSVLVPHVWMELFGGEHILQGDIICHVSSRSRAGTALPVFAVSLPFTFPRAKHLLHSVWAAVPWGLCLNTMKALLFPQSRSQEQGWSMPPPG